MKIFTTTSDEFNAFRRFFEGHEFNILPKNYKGIKIDLLLFPGGSDVHPRRYGSKLPQNSSFSEWVDEERDEWEFDVIKGVFSGELSPKKVLGVCRGMQFINVAMGGTLIYDIYTRYGRIHPSVHEISWQSETVFSSIKTVNSSHHQGVRSAGSNMRPRILAVDSNLQFPEAMMYGNDYLGFQFHPELWGNKDEMKILSSGILNWVEGKGLSVLSGKQNESETSRKSRYVSDFTQQEQQIGELLANWYETPEETNGGDEDEDEEMED